MISADNGNPTTMTPAPTCRQVPLAAVGAVLLLALLSSVATARAGDAILLEARTLARDGASLLRLTPAADVVPSRDVVLACTHQILTLEDVLVFDTESGQCSTLPGNQRADDLELHRPPLSHGDLEEFETVDACLRAHHAALVDDLTGFATCFRWFDCDALEPVVSGPGQVCSGDEVVLDAGPGFAEYYWEPGGETTQEIVVTPWVDTEYVVVVTDEWACTGSSAHFVEALPLPEPQITGPSAICSGETVTLDAGAGWAAYDWSTGATTQTIDVSPAATTAFTVAVADANGCRDTSSEHLVTVDEVWAVEFADQTVSSDVSVRSCAVIDAGPNVLVVPPAHLVLQAGETVALHNGFTVGSGARLTIRLEASLNGP